MNRYVRRNMKRFQIFWVITLGLCFINPPSWATTAYVTDSLKVTLRTGPSTENKIIAMLSSGEPVEIVEIRDDWTRIRLLNPESEQKEGWLLSRFLIKRQPWEAKARDLSRENASIREKLALIEEKWKESSRHAGEFQKKLRHTSEALEQAQTNFDSLKKEASDYLKLKEEYEAIRSTLQKAQENIQNLTDENESLKSSQHIKWFLAGALIVFSSLLIGLIIGRQQRKRKTSLGRWTL
jgi:SH3 domain protein